LSSVYRAAFEQSQSALILLGRDGLYECNTAALRLFEVPDVATFAEIGIAGLSPPFQPDGRPSEELAADRIEEAHHHGSTAFEWAHRTFSGTSFTAQVTLDRLDVEQGPLVQAVVHDISALADERDRLRHLHKAHDVAQRIAQVGHWSYDIRANEVRLSPELFRLLGLEPSDAVLSVESFMSMVHPDDRARVHAAMEEAMTGGVSEVVHRALRPDGSMVTLRAAGEVEFDGEGRPIHMYGTSQDITAQRELENNLYRLVAILDSAPEIIGMFDGLGAMLYLNAAGRRRVGLPPPSGGDHWTPGQGWNQDGLPPETRSVEQTAYTFQPAWAAERNLNESLPAALENGTWQGETVIQPLNGPEFPAHETIIAHRDADGALSQISIMLRDISEQKAAESEIHRLAYFDALTQLPNRRLLATRLDEAMAHSRREEQLGAVLFLDLDQFKAINDASGHQAGDALLVDVARRLRASLRASDIVARVGGDEFVVLLENLGDATKIAADAARRVADKLRAANRFPPGTEAHRCNITMSVGVYLFDGSEDGGDTLLRCGDQALYTAKRSGRNRVCFFDRALQQMMDDRAALEADLRQAVPNGELSLRYQAQVNADGTVTGAEALLRWQHPTRASVPPGEFIPMAEDSGLIHVIDRWVLEVACDQLAAWSREPVSSELKLAVNVSAARFHASDFVDSVRHALDRSGAPATRLELELTESLLLTDVEEAASKIRALKALGVGFAIDDFGTGYSALAYLTCFPFDRLKIDKSFVATLPDSRHHAVVTHTIINMARSLGLEVIAEGVETVAQRDWLIRQGCLAHQGFLFSRPVEPAELVALLPTGQSCQTPLQ